MVLRLELTGVQRRSKLYVALTGGSVVAQP
jgi:hypothetical protein